ncbi:hypothetical protein ACFV1L_22710 [Kitasatospora sp. NPDC059646]|uniref:hypothetical protein n=1 Tax=Kitasatospora sp. NPDC059646 TaxID=3346893 RepID=UPI0036AD6FCA
MDKYALVDCVVIGHQHYGPRTRTTSGDVPGFVAAEAVSDDPASGAETGRRSGSD